MHSRTTATGPQAAHGVLRLAPEAQALFFTEACAANTFADEPVNDAQLEAIFALSQRPPTMANTNPLRWLVVRSL